MYISAIGDSVKPEYPIPWPGLLNDGTQYFWRVRAKDTYGAWGKWSPIWSFIPHGVMMPLGNHQVEFNGQNLPTGVYFYRFEAGEYVQTRKMLLVQ
jgi:hypothetical protein